MEIAFSINVGRLYHKTEHFAKLFVYGKNTNAGLKKKKRKKDWVFFRSFVLSNTPFLVCLILLKN